MMRAELLTGMDIGILFIKNCNLRNQALGMGLSVKNKACVIMENV
jgi:hypothetical protein